MLLHHSPAAVEQSCAGIRDFLPRRVEKFQLAVETGEASKTGAESKEPALAAYEPVSA